MTDLAERHEMKDELNARWDSLKAELDALMRVPEDEVDPENEDRVSALNEELCEISDWILAIHATIRSKETTDVPD